MSTKMFFSFSKNKSKKARIIPDIDRENRGFIDFLERQASWYGGEIWGNHW